MTSKDIISVISDYIENNICDPLTPEMLAEKAMEDPCKPGNPREVTKEDFMELYRQAW